MTITDHPLHRSRRAALPHRAPALGEDAEALQRMEVTDSGRRQAEPDETAHPYPRQPIFLAAASQSSKPPSPHDSAKRRDVPAVHRHAIGACVPPSETFIHNTSPV
jgi:hypothetical protein